MYELHYSIVNQSPSANRADLAEWAKAIEAQLVEDLRPEWGRTGTCVLQDEGEGAPHGKVPVYILNELDEPGALGYHTDVNGQPVIYVQYQGDQTPITISHECLESLPDPFGFRLALPVDLGKKFGKVRTLIEISDPPEDKSYQKGGVPVSDFVLPNWYDEKFTKGTRYTFRGNIDHPMRLIPGGYYSFVDIHNVWWQQTWFGGPEPMFRKLGQKEDQVSSNREWIDKLTREFKSNP